MLEEEEEAEVSVLAGLQELTVSIMMNLQPSGSSQSLYQPQPRSLHVTSLQVTSLKTQSEGNLDLRFNCEGNQSDTWKNFIAAVLIWQQVFFRCKALKGAIKSLSICLDVLTIMLVTYCCLTCADFGILLNIAVFN